MDVFSCSEDPDVKGTETALTPIAVQSAYSCSEDPDVKGTETQAGQPNFEAMHKSCSEDPDVKGTETRSRLSASFVALVAARIPM